jgi:hypothetical protein
MGKDSADGVRSFRRNYREVLSDAKFSLEDRDLFLDGLELECSGAAVNNGLEFDSSNVLQREEKYGNRDFHFCSRLATPMRFRILPKVTHGFLIHGSFCISVPAGHYRAFSAAW